MNRRHDETTESLSAAERAFVEQIRDASSPPRQSAYERRAFDERLEASVRRSPVRLSLGWSTAVATAALCAIWLTGEHGKRLLAPARTDAVAGDATDLSGSAQQDAILSIVIDPDSMPAETLPVEYEAIASVFIDG